MQRKHEQHERRLVRRGSVLLAVLVIVAMLSLGAYTFSEIMVTEAEGTAMFGRAVQARLFADSAIDLVLAVLATGATDVDLYHDPEQFQHYLVRDSDRARGRGYFAVVAPVETDTSAQSIRFGLIDESAKLNLNSLLSDSDADPDELRLRLMYLPNMTEEIADAILDWLDKDDEQRQFGAESDYYLTLDPPYEAKNGPMESLEELLLVAGVTPELLYGEDANRNGLLDPNEDDGDLSPPDDNADGILDLGWSAYLTVYSRESNLRADGSEKINLNTSDLAQLYDQIETEFGEETAKFVVAYRIYGAVAPEGQSQPGSEVSEQAEQQARQAAEQLGRSLFGGGRQQQVSRGGLDLSQGAKEKINSVFDLIGVEVQAEVNGQSTTLTSPWPDDPGQMQSYLPQLIDAFTTVAGPYREGRINVNQARKEVFRAGHDGRAGAVDRGIPSHRIERPTADRYNRNTIDDRMALHRRPDDFGAVARTGSVPDDSRQRVSSSGGGLL
ncbi:MAG: general secretion pathway protein GspK [Planctomycetes bacterium]|nr:general secretion pathway protein GspK [Planctomycetota bacterium]